MHDVNTILYPMMYEGPMWCDHIPFLAGSQALDSWKEAKKALGIILSIITGHSGHNQNH